MKTIYLDSEFVCHISPGIGSTPYETDLFEGKCDTYIEGYRVIPAGQTWVRSDGVRFVGLSVSPAVKYETLVPWQKQYEEDLDNMVMLSDVAELVESIYEDDLGVIG